LKNHLKNIIKTHYKTKPSKTQVRSELHLLAPETPMGLIQTFSNITKALETLFLKNLEMLMIK